MGFTPRQGHRGGRRTNFRLAVCLPGIQGKPVLFSGLACANVLFTLDRRDFRNLLGRTIHGLRVLTSDEFLRIEREAGRVR